ncbi:hypothetical protein F511_27742 [Dorcoceras hygrometricum]|uniref:Dystroglycan-like n=1 Tax=Dorcoceras hygrometricum TaxID=472368 RepID=A0A2Z7CLA7_9LAMI|nr:hypothetical protein F511_27742 [Dorcoceras hygrometricum]
MASSLISNSHHVDFDSVFGINDATITQMFELLIATGLKDFLGCPTVYYEAALLEFFENGSVREDGVVVSTIRGINVEISEGMFAKAFGLPTEGLIDVSDVPKDLVFDARSLFSESEEQEDDFVVDEPVEESATGVQETSTDIPVSEEQPAADPDDIIEQILIQLDTATRTQDDNIETWFDRAFNEEFATTGQEKQDSEEEIIFDVAKTGEEASSSKHHHEELMSLDDLLIQISEDTVLPSVTAAEITKIRLGESINIQEVQERDVYYASLPRISIHDKGKEPLVEDEPLPDVDGLNALKEKEKLMLEWAGTDSLETAVKRRLYILAKYREMLLRKFLESHQKYLVSGQPCTTTTSQIIDILSVAHSKSLEVLVTQQKENGLPIEQPCTSTYLDTSICSGAVLAQFFSQAKSKCWVRPMVQIDGLWTPIQGSEFLRSSCKLSLFVNKRQVPESVVEEDFVPHGCVIEPFQYWGAATSLVKTWGWARVCTDVVRYHMFGCLRSVCKDIVVYNLGVERIPDYLLDDFEQGVNIDTFVAYFSSSRTQGSPEIDSDSSDGSTVYCSPSPPDDSFTLGLVVSPTSQEENLYFVEGPKSPPHPLQSQDSTSSSSDSPVHFDSADINLDNTAEAQSYLPAANVDLSFLLNALQASISQSVDTAHHDILSRLRTVEHSLQTSLGHQNDYLRVSAETNSLVDRSRFNAIDAKFLLLDGQIAAIRNDQLEFQSKIAANILSLSTQIGDIADYIRGGDAKKGEIGSSSRRPPPVRVERRPLPTQANQGERSLGHGRVINVEEAAEMVREADRQADRREREREREKRLRRLRRRGH